MIIIRSFLLSKSRRPRLRHPLVPILPENFGKIPKMKKSHLHHPIYKAVTKLGVLPVQLRENKVKIFQNALKLFLEDIFRRDFF